MEMRGIINHAGAWCPGIYSKKGERMHLLNWHNWYLGPHAGGHSWGVYCADTGKDVALVYNRDAQALEKAALIAAAPEMFHALESVYSNAADHPDKIRAIIDKALDKVRNLQGA